MCIKLKLQSQRKEVTAMDSNITIEQISDLFDTKITQLKNDLELSLDEKLETKLEEKLETILEEKLETILEEKLETKLDKKLDEKLAIQHLEAAFFVNSMMYLGRGVKNLS